MPKQVFVEPILDLVLDDALEDYACMCDDRHRVAYGFGPLKTPLKEPLKDPLKEPLKEPLEGPFGAWVQDWGSKACIETYPETAVSLN